MVEVTPLAISEVKLVVARRHADDRGYFSETWNRRSFAEAGLDADYCQDNHSLSRRRGTVRGLHFQAPPSAQTKLVRVLRGSVFDVAVDIRRGSPTFARHVAVTLSADDGAQLLVPRGFAHGFCTLEDDTEVLYKVDQFYDPACDLGLRWDDPALEIPWPIPSEQAVLSDKDRALPLLSALPVHFVYGETED